jgi:hypothetical protein
LDSDVLGTVPPERAKVETGQVDTEFEVTMMTIYYEIRIAGLVPAGALRGFEQLAAEQLTETMVRGPLPDQAALQGLLARLESSGFQLMGLRRQENQQVGLSHRGAPDK